MTFRVITDFGLDFKVDFPDLQAVCDYALDSFGFIGRDYVHILSKIHETYDHWYVLVHIDLHDKSFSFTSNCAYSPSFVKYLAESDPEYLFSILERKTNKAID